jgi:tRNA threonylcarbamoyl adenosine modification protein YjeE
MILSSLRETKKLAEKIGKKISKNDTLLFYGEIGVGKTTFVRNLVHFIQQKNKKKKTEVLSPTFNIVYEYKIKNSTIMHYDFYRLKNSHEINHLDLFLDNNKVINLIEWPELINSKPKNRLELFFSYLKNLDKREVKIEYYGKWKKYDFEKN